MKHGVKKIRFGRGYDYDKIMVRKLANDFFLRGKIELTTSRAKAIKPVIESLITKMKVENQANKNYLLKTLANNKVINQGFEVIGKAIAKINGGYLRIVKTGARLSDGSEMARLEWAHPVVLEQPKKEVVKKETVKKEVVNKTK